MCYASYVSCRSTTVQIKEIALYVFVSNEPDFRLHKNRIRKAHTHFFASISNNDAVNDDEYVDMMMPYNVHCYILYV